MHRISVQRRRGSFLVEVVVAAALFATAAIALARLAQTASSLSAQADQRLSAQLVAENTIARLQFVPLAELTAESKRVAETVSEASGLNVNVTTETFSAVEVTDEPDQDDSSMHLIVRVGLSGTDSDDTMQKSVTLHDWRIAEQDND